MRRGGEVAPGGGSARRDSIFYTKRARLVTQAETWRRLPAAVRPAAEAAAETDTAEVPSFGAGGFVQV